MFRNRQEAGQILAQKLKDFKGKDVIILGLARGGVVVAWEIAEDLQAPFDVLVVRKIGAPGNEELAIGAVGPDKTVFWEEALCRGLGVDENYKKKILEIKAKEREEKEDLLRQGRKALLLKGKAVILVDDGIATGATTQAALFWIKSQKPQKVILATPVAPPEVVEKLRPQVDKLICLKIEPDFWAVGQFYEEFSQVEDKEVKRILDKN